MSEAISPTGVEMEESPSIAALAAALAKAQGAMEPAKKESTNSHFKNRYADLAAIWEAARKPLSSNGLAVMQRVTSTATGVLITTHLVHASGEWVKDRCEWPVNQRTPQGIGSAITYGKRYALAALLGIAAEEDDDGNAASEVRPPKTSGHIKTDAVKAQLAAKQAGPWEQISSLLIRAGKSGADAAAFVKGVTGKADRKSLTQEDVDKVADALDVLRAEAAQGEIQQ